jgi:uncharacterized damage-inducible protein DinB
MPFDRTELLARLRRSRDLVLAHFDAPADDLEKTYGPGKWTVRQQLVHLADCEAVYFWRLARAIAEPGSVVEGFEQDDWARKLGYERRSIAVARAHFAAAREAILELVVHATDAQLRQEARHSQNGPTAGWTFASRTANHGLRHVDQMDAARAGRPWINPGPMTA